jgi:hypothetical protein
MNDRVVEAEKLLRLLEYPEAKLYFGLMQKDFDDAMKRMLGCPREALETERGYARALHEQLKKFSDARTEVMAANK